MSERLANKVALITGGATGLGYAIAERFISEGAIVVISDIDTTAGEKAAAKLGARFEHQNVVDEEHWTELLSKLSNDGLKLTTLVNNAGIEIDEGVGIEDIEIDRVQRTFDVNLIGTLLGCKHGVRHMKGEGGSIINLSSIGGLIPSPKAISYGASKAAVRHLTQTVAMECAEKAYSVRCNSIHPGLIKTRMLDEIMEGAAKAQNISLEEASGQFTGMVPSQEIGQALDVANAALYLASDESRYVTGDRLMVDGGMLLTS